MRKAGKEAKMKEMKKKKMRNKRIGIANKAKLERKWNSNTPLRRGQVKQTEGRDLLRAHLRKAGGRGQRRDSQQVPQSCFHISLKNIQSVINVEM